MGCYKILKLYLNSTEPVIVEKEVTKFPSNFLPTLLLSCTHFHFLYSINTLLPLIQHRNNTNVGDIFLRSSPKQRPCILFSPLLVRALNIHNIVIRIPSKYKCYFFSLNMWLAFPFRIREVPVSKPGQETGYPDWGVSRFSSVSPDECQDSTSKLGHYRFLSNPFQFIINLSLYNSTLHSLSCRKIILKLQINRLSVKVSFRTQVFFKQIQFFICV
jgi:hypothetical protein